MKAIHQNIKKGTVKIITVIVLLFFTTQQAKAVCPVSADFTYQKVGNTVTFTPAQQADSLTNFYWYFGDNATSTQSGVVSHTYINAGNYNVYFSVNSRDPLDTSIRCGQNNFQDILILDSIPCLHKNTILTTNLFYPDNNYSYRFNADYNGCLFPNSFTVLENANHGTVTQNGTSQFFYNIESLGSDTIKIISCNAINNCDTTTHIINISQRPECNQIIEDTIYLQLDTTFSGAYNVPSFFDSITQIHQKFILEEWSTSTFTLTPNRLFDSIIQLYRYIDSVSNNIFEFNGNTSIYSTNNNAVAYSGGDGLKFFIPTIISSSQTRFNYSLNTSANYCSPFPINGRYFLTNQNFYYPYSSCAPNNVGITFYQNGINNVTIIDSINNCFENVVFVIGDSSQSLCDTVTCLLPGDADHDLTVNNYDALAIGLSYNRTGIIRPNATTQYALQPCDDWNTTHYYGYNDKFADCNGDGRINSSDAVVISQNYIVQAQNHFNHRGNGLDSLPSVTLVFDTLPTTVITGNCDGAEIVADIHIGSAAQPIINGYGVAFSVNYPFDNDSCFSVQVDLDPNSWLQTNNPVLLFYKDIPEFKRVDITVVRTDGVARTGNGRIGKIKMITEGAVFRNGRLNGNKIFDFSVTTTAAINNIGQRIDIDGSLVSVNFGISNIKQNKVDGLRFYPNPTAGKIYINAKETIESIRILDTQGRIINELSSNKNEIQIDISTVENGMYILEIKGNNSVSYEKIFKQ